MVVRDLTDLLDGPVFEPIAANDAMFRRLRAHDWTVVWSGDVDIAPETLTDGPDPKPADNRRPAALSSRCQAQHVDGKRMLIT